MQTTTIRPGFLVSLKTSLRGNVSYQTRDLDAERSDDGALTTRWETERTISDPAELERATKIRSKARSLISAVCAHSAFGLLCPEADATGLAQAIDAAQAMADEFNRTAQCTRLAVFVLAGKIAADDVQAAAAINSEVRDLLDRMEQGVRNLDVTVIRDAANRAKQLSAMITPDASARLQQAIDKARSAARTLVKAGETAAAEIDYRAIRAINESRTAFLDMGEATEVAAPTVAARALDLEEAPAEPTTAATRPAVPLDMDAPAVVVSPVPLRMAPQFDFD